MSHIHRLFSFALHMLLILSLVSVCANQAYATDSDGLVLQDQPLVGRIWDVRRKQFVNEQQLHEAALNSKYLLLGETHDNISHHRHQAALIALLADEGRNASVHFEMIDDSQYERLEKVRVDSSEELIALLQENKAGWDYDTMYKVVFEQVIKAGFKIYPANLSHQSIRNIIKEGESRIPQPIKQLIDDTELTTAQRQSMSDEIIEGHCNALPQSMVAPMMRAQRVRDARMARSLMQANTAHRVLIAGTGHTRNDRGVPMYLQIENNKPDNRNKETILSIAFMEVIPDKTDPDAYIERWQSGALPFDYVWFTPRFDRDDPCEGFAEKMNNKK